MLFNTVSYASGLLSVGESRCVHPAELPGHRQSGTAEPPIAVSSATLLRVVQLNLGNVRSGPAFLLHILLDYIVDRKFPTIESLQEELDETVEAIISHLLIPTPGCCTCAATCWRSARASPTSGRSW